jgi:hypothetical protein
MKTGKDLENLNWVSILLIVISVLFVLGSFTLPYILTQYSLWVYFDEKSGQIGDTVGGIMNPFIGIASVAMMFLAFYMQYNANKLQRKLFDEQIQNEKKQFKEEIEEQRKQFERNQFENQFFEMLKTHKENSNLIINSYQESEEGKGFLEEAAYRQRKENRKKGFEYLVERINNEYEEWKKNDKEGDIRHIFNKAYTHQWEDSFGHYFRHLFLLVKFVVSKEFLKYEEKRNYLRILRASLSTYEQIFLYYNWLSNYGQQWENECNHFFTNYRMIHNVNYAIHEDFNISKMSPFKELLKSGGYDTEEGRDNHDDTLFELIK